MNKIKKTIPLLIILLQTSFYSYCQEGIDQEFIGQWSVKDVAIAKGLEPSVQNMMLMMKKGFTGAQFVFGNDGKFEIQFKENIPPMMKEIPSLLNGRNWKYDRSKKRT